MTRTPYELAQLIERSGVRGWLPLIRGGRRDRPRVLLYPSDQSAPVPIETEADWEAWRQAHPERFPLDATVEITYQAVAVRTDRREVVVPAQEWDERLAGLARQKALARELRSLTLDQQAACYREAAQSFLATPYTQTTSEEACRYCGGSIGPSLAPGNNPPECVDCSKPVGTPLSQTRALEIFKTLAGGPIRVDYLQANDDFPDDYTLGWVDAEGEHHTISTVEQWEAWTRHAQERA